MKFIGKRPASFKQITIELLFFVEGRTEKIYLEQLNKILDIHHIKFKFIGSSNHKSSIKNIESSLNRTNIADRYVVIIFDADCDTDSKLKFLQKKSLFKGCKQHLILISSPSIETWLNMHHTNVKIRLSKTDETILHNLAIQYQKAYRQSKFKEKALNLESNEKHFYAKFIIKNNSLELTNFHYFFEQNIEGKTLLNCSNGIA